MSSGDNQNSIFINIVSAAVIGLLGWNIVTLHNISGSLGVLGNKVDAVEHRLDRIEDTLYFQKGDNGEEQIR